jgi:1,2-phenylacetyl-CoA epoxidase catalytic subunit
MCLKQQPLCIILNDFLLTENALESNWNVLEFQKNFLKQTYVHHVSHSLFGLTLNQRFDFFSWLICNKNNMNKNHFSHSLFALNLNQKIIYFFMITMQQK